jgi:hypothetical protein
MNEVAKGGSGDNYKTLLKQAQAATPGQFKEKLTLDMNKMHSFNQVKQVLKNQAQSLELQLINNGSMKTSELQQKVPGLRRAVGRYKNLTDTNWLTKVYKDKFVVEDGVIRLKKPAPAAAPKPTETLPASREGGSSSSRALPANYSVPALVFRGAVEVPKRTRAQMQEAKRMAEELKEQKRQEKRNAWAEREVAKQLKQLDRLVKRSA